MRPGAYLVDRFPWLKYVPGYGRRLRRYYEVDLKFYCDQLNRVKRTMVILLSCHCSMTTRLKGNPSRQTMLGHRSQERCWKVSMTTDYPLMRWLFSLELCSKLDVTRYDAFLDPHYEYIGVHRLRML